MTSAAVSTAGQRNLARLALLCAVASAGVLLIFAGLKSVALLALGAAAIVVMVTGFYVFLVTRGGLRWVAISACALAPILFLALCIGHRLLLEVVVAVGLLALAVASARAALDRDRPRESLGMSSYEAPPPRRPYLIMNPYSGGGSVVRYGLRERAEALGAEVELIEGPGHVDVAALARAAADRGVDLLGVAGGDGTQALVAAVAAERGLPFLVVSAGTRNHFALDLGLDREHPVSCLEALADGVEVRVDLGLANGRTFVNNISFGAYAEIVQSPEYRNDKRGTTLNLLPDLLTREDGSGLAVQAGVVTLDSPQAVLVSNNVYGSTDLAGLGRRARLDEGQLGVTAIRVDNLRQALGLLRRAHRRGLQRFTSTDVVVSSKQARIPVGIDGEAIFLESPVQCTVRQGALRVRVPRNRPGVPSGSPPLDWSRLYQLVRPSRQ